MSAPTTSVPVTADAAAATYDTSGAPVRHRGDLARFVFGLLILVGGLLALAVDKSAALGVSLDILALIDWIPEAVDKVIVGTIQFLAVVAPFALLARLLFRRWYRAVGVTAIA